MTPLSPPAALVAAVMIAVASTAPIVRGAGGARCADAVVTGLDHIPIAVNDLDAAAARYREPGFTLKPGVRHDNGIRNQHASRRFSIGATVPRSVLLCFRGGMIRKLASGGYRLYSRKKDPKTGKRRNLGTFKTRAEAGRHERAVQRPRMLSR
jgi:hypothetical protein